MSKAFVSYRRPLARLLAFVFALQLCALSGCMREAAISEAPEAPEAVLHVAISQESALLGAAQYLLDTDSRMELEEQLDVSIQVSVLEGIESIEDLAALSFSDVLLSDDPMWIVPLAERGQLAQLSDQAFLADSRSAECGRYSGRQYAYPLTKAWSKPSHTVLLVQLEALLAAGIIDIPYTPEAFKAALEKLGVTSRSSLSGKPTHEIIEGYSGAFRTPLTVYGLPTDGGCSVLLGLFGLAPNSGREFRLSGTQVVLDKTTDAGRAYLEYIAALHEEGLIPSDFLSMSAYNVIMRFADGLSPIVIMDEAHLDAAILYAEQNGHRAAVARLPVADATLDAHIYRRMMGMVSSNSRNRLLAETLLCCLYEKTGDWAASESDLDAYETYPLFLESATIRKAVYDPVEHCTFDARLHYEKYGKDEIISRFFARIAANDLPISAFDDMLQQLYLDADDESTTTETIADRFTRKYLLQFSSVAP